MQRVRVPTDKPAWVLAQRRAAGACLRRTREGQGISQERLAEAMGLDRKTVNRMEVGAYAAGIDKFILAAGVLGVTLGELFQGMPAVAKT